jgi:hypothetical protein
MGFQDPLNSKGRTCYELCAVGREITMTSLKEISTEKHETSQLRCTVSSAGRAGTPLFALLFETHG